VLGHLWTKEPIPLEYLELTLCRDVYHCPPSQLPPWHKIKRHLICMDAEAQVRTIESKRKGSKRG